MAIVYGKSLPPYGRQGENPTLVLLGVSCFESARHVRVLRCGKGCYLASTACQVIFGEVP